MISESTLIPLNRISRRKVLKINKMKEDLSIAEIRLIIRNLITFIVVEGKEYVSDELKREYVKGYVHLLIKIVNQIDEEEKTSLVEDIASDISTYLN